MQNLLARQRDKMQDIKAELENNGRKTSHWAWWVFPTELPGASEPPPETYVTPATAHRLFDGGSCANEWREVLEQICALTETNGQTVLPSIDHGRVHYFIKFWSTSPVAPDWMRMVVTRLEKFTWEQSYFHCVIF